jgi:hypothetical protein
MQGCIVSEQFKCKISLHFGIIPFNFIVYIALTIIAHVGKEIIYLGKNIFILNIIQFQLLVNQHYYSQTFKCMYLVNLAQRSTAKKSLKIYV